MRPYQVQLRGAVTAYGWLTFPGIAWDALRLRAPCGLGLRQVLDLLLRPRRRG